MSSIAENKMYPTVRMSKTKKRVTAATKLQALVRGKLARRTATAKKQQKQVKGRSAYKSYLSSFTLDNTEKVGGFAGLDLLHSFQPQLEQSLKEHGGLKIHISSICSWAEWNLSAVSGVQGIKNERRKTSAAG